MRLFLRRLLLVLSVSVLLLGRVEADSPIAFSNIPPPASYKIGGSTVTGGGLKALLFTTPSSSSVMITSVKVGLTYCNASACGRPSTPVGVYPSQADFQVSMYSVRNQGGVLTPDVELYSIPMQYGLTLTGTGTEFTFDIPNWQLAANTTYALVGRSTDANPVKWANIELGSPPNDYPAQAQNGFLFSSSTAFYTTQSQPTTWLVTAATNNSVEMKFLIAEVTPGGIVTSGISGGTFVAGTAQFNTPSNPPTGQSFPYDVFGFTASTSVGGSITITLTYPQTLAAGTKVWKDLNGTWLDWTNNVTISGNTITYSITDGGAGDADGLVNGSITDPLGPAITVVPTLSEWSQMLLGLMVLTMIGWHFHRERLN